MRRAKIEEQNGFMLARQREFRIFLPEGLGEDLLKRRVTAQSLKEVADSGVGHGNRRLLTARMLAR